MKQSNNDQGAGQTGFCEQNNNKKNIFFEKGQIKFYDLQHFHFHILKKKISQGQK